MSFLDTIGFLETAEQEQARLAEAPAGSLNHHLSGLPVNTTGWVEDAIIELPTKPWAENADTAFRVVVVPISFRPPLTSGDEAEALPRRRHAGSWECAVVASDDPRYPVGGHRLSISTAELVRGTQINIFEFSDFAALAADESADDAETFTHESGRVCTQVSNDSSTLLDLEPGMWLYPGQTRCYRNHGDSE